jgi:hypothetical protein
MFEILDNCYVTDGKKFITFASESSGVDKIAA